MAYGFTFDWADIQPHVHANHVLKNDIDDLLIKAEKQPSIWLGHSYEFSFITTIRNQTGGLHGFYLLFVHDSDDLLHLKLTYDWDNSPSFFIDDALFHDIMSLQRAKKLLLAPHDEPDAFANWISQIADKFTLNPREDIDKLSDSFSRWGNFFVHHLNDIKEHFTKKSLRQQRQLRRELRKQFPKEVVEP